MTLAVIGAGMVGCATALALKKRGHDVVVYERRPDPRLESSKEIGRSINLALSARGYRGLQSVAPEVCERIQNSIVPMKGRMVHSKEGKMSPSLYGVRGTEAINSISRAELNNSLIDAVERARIPIKFNTASPATYSELIKLGTSVFGCDGTYSRVREVISKHVDHKLEMETISTYYLEVPIQKADQWEKNYLHVWPRGSHMFIALPNADDTWTGTLFAPRDLFVTELTSPDAFLRWFATEFGDAAAVVGVDALKSLAVHAPRGKLTSIKCSPYNVGGKIVILGDAAHSMVPFYGQGLNAGLEDVRILMENFIDKYPDPAQWGTAFDEYSRFRKPDLDAINDLSMSNYQEMRSSVATLHFKARKQLDNALARVLGDYWLPLYTMVSFRDDIRYSDALASSARQQRLIHRLVTVAEGSGLILAAAALVKYLNSRH